MKIKSMIVLICIVSLLINACNMVVPPPVIPPTALPNPVVSIDMFRPYNGSIYTVGATVNLWAYIAGVGLQISEHTFLVNGVSVAASTYDSGNLNGTWIAANPGEYYIQGKVTLTDGSIAISEPTRICVISLTVAVPDMSGYLGPCPLATPIPNLQSTGSLAINVVVAPNPIPFSYLCTPNPTITFIATVDDPQDQVALVGVNVLSPTGTTWPFYLNWVTTRPVNQEEYRTTFQLSPDALGVVTSLHWQVIAFGRDGHQLQMIEGDIPVQPIQCSQQPHPGILPPTLTPVASCPPGTYYAPATNRCIQIQVNPNNNPDNGGEQPGSQPLPPACLKNCPQP